MEMKTVTYPRVVDNNLGRNRHFKSSGMDILFTDHGDEGGQTVYLEPRTSKGAMSSACRVVVPAEALPDLIDRLYEVHEATKPRMTFIQAFAHAFSLPMGLF
jgi:hypothetical protein